MAVHHVPKKKRGTKEEESDERCFINPFPKFPDAKDLITAELQVKLKESIVASLIKLDQRVDDGNDQSIYTGGTGIALLHLHAAYRLHDDSPADLKQHLQNAVRILQPYLRELKTRRVTFLCGAAGPLALAAYLYHLLGEPTKSMECVSRLRELCPKPDSPDSPDSPDLSYEVLYGHAGYLYALLWVGALVPGGLDENLVQHEVEVILDAGQRGGRADGHHSTIMFTWHGKHYLGAAHGLAGIITVLLQVQGGELQSRIIKVVEPYVDYLITCCFPSGNLPSSLESRDRDRLVQWCHGAPGLVHLLAQAYKVLHKKSYFEAALRCGEVVWHRGLLLKGYGLCHGVSGNAYTFLQLYRLTGDRLHLYRAVKFAEWCLSSEERRCPTPDHPYSMFEGLAGRAYFYCDLFAPEKATFPALELLSPY